MSHWKKVRLKWFTTLNISFQAKYDTCENWFLDVGKYFVDIRQERSDKYD